MARLTNWTARHIALVLSLALAGPVALDAMPARAQDNRVYTVGNYPVEARAQDAVAAKEKAVTDGQNAAFRSLLKRLTPVTSYKTLSQFKGIQAGNLISGISVRSERNSTTSYRASLDFSFDVSRVRDLLQQRGVPFVDTPSRETAVVLVVQSAGSQASGTQAASSPFTAKTWRDAWSGLDLDNGLVPVKLHDRPAALTPEVLKAAATNGEAPLRSIAVLAKSGQALVALAEPDVAARRLHVTLSGSDGVGPFVLKRTWRMDPADAFYAGEMAAVVALGILEGRWKALHARQGVISSSGGAALQPVQIYVEFRSAQEWQNLQRLLTETPGVSDFSVGGLSARSADVALRYPGGGGALAEALVGSGVDLRGTGGAWYARSIN